MEIEYAKDAIEEVLFESLAVHLDSKADCFRSETRISSIALDSIVAITVLSELQHRFKVDLPPILFWESETLGEVAGHIRESIQNR